MAFIRLALVATLGLAVGQQATAQTQAQATRPNPAQKPILAWSSKPAQLVPYDNVNRLVWRLADIEAKHKDEKDWVETVANTRDVIAQWISLGPGEKTKTVFYADDRVYWVVERGAMRVTIEGQQPFIATRHFLVQIPKRLQYSIETVGAEPSLRFEVRPSGEPPQYPINETPTPIPGVKYVQAVYTGRGEYDKINRPYIDFEKQIVQGGEKLGVWVRDDHTFVTILRSAKGIPTPPDTEWGHFHENFPEFWLIVEGTQQFLVEGEPLVTVHEGDLVATPIGRWHRAEPYGEGPSTRLAFIPRPDNLHWYQPGYNPGHN